MTVHNLQGIAEVVIRRARRQGFILPREVREELNRAELAESLWKDVLALARPALSYRQGRYHYTHPVSARVREDQSQKLVVQKAIRQLIRQHRTANRAVERRQQDRVDFVHPVEVQTQEGRQHTFLTRDLSPAGIRLVGTRNLLGQKVRVFIPAPAQANPEESHQMAQGWRFLVHILWTCSLGDDLVENGGTILETQTLARDVDGATTPRWASLSSEAPLKRAPE